MKQAVLLCLTLGLAPVYGEEHVQAPAVAPIFLYFQFQHQAAPAVVNAMRDELRSIMDPIGLRFDWRSLQIHSAEVSSELAVVTFKGSCDAGNLIPRSALPGALGWTHVSDGTILPFSDVDCDRVRSFVQRELLTIDPIDREEVYGRAIGRVLAHELYHIFANTQKHGAWGVAKSAYTVQELLSDDFRFEEKETEALRGSRSHAAPESPAASN